MIAKSRLCGLFVSFLGFQTSCGGALESPERRSSLAALLADAQSAYDARHFGRSRDLYEKALTLSPGHPVALMGLSYATLGVHDLNLVDLTAALTREDRLAREVKKKPPLPAARTSLSSPADFRPRDSSTNETGSWNGFVDNVLDKTSDVMTRAEKGVRDVREVRFVLKVLSRFPGFRDVVSVNCQGPDEAEFSWGCAENAREPQDADYAAWVRQLRLEIRGRPRSELLDIDLLRRSSPYLRDSHSIWRKLCHHIASRTRERLLENSYLWSDVKTRNVLDLETCAPESQVDASDTRDEGFPDAAGNPKLFLVPLVLSKMADTATLYHLVFDTDGDGEEDHYAMAKSLGREALNLKLRVEKWLSHIHPRESRRPLNASEIQEAQQIRRALEAKKLEAFAIGKDLEAVLASDLPLTLIKNAEIVNLVTLDLFAGLPSRKKNDPRQRLEALVERFGRLDRAAQDLLDGKRKVKEHLERNMRLMASLQGRLHDALQAAQLQTPR